MKRIQKNWESYLERVVPPNAEIEQVVETKKAFYAGAGVVIHSLINEIVDLSEEKGSHQIELMVVEIEEWIESVQKEAAKHG